MMRTTLSYAFSRGAAKRFNECEQVLKREGENSSDRRARMANLLAAKRDDPPVLWAGEGRIRGNARRGQQGNGSLIHGRRSVRTATAELFNTRQTYGEESDELHREDGHAACLMSKGLQPGRSSLPSAHSSPMPCLPVRLWPGGKTGGDKGCDGVEEASRRRD